MAKEVPMEREEGGGGGGGDDPAAGDSVEKVNGGGDVPLVIVNGTHQLTPKSTPKESPRTRPLSESSEPAAEHQPNGKSTFEHHNNDESAYSELEYNNLPDNDFQSTYSINDLQGFPVRADLIVDHLPVPPDGGYGWVIVAAAFLCNFIVDGTSNAFGPFMASYQEAFGASKAAVSLVGSLLVGMYLLSGPIAGALLNNYDARKVIIAGTFLSSTAFALSTLSPNIFVHYFLYGILGGIGFGFIYLPAIVVVSQYFEAKRALATGVSVAGSGFGTFVLPLLSKFLIESFGWKVALSCIALLVLLCALCGMLFRPLPMPEFDLEKQNKLNEEIKQQALLAALSRADAGGDEEGEEEEERQSNVSEGGTTMAGGISPVKRSATTRTSSQCTKEDGHPLLNGVEGEGAEELVIPSSPVTPHRPPLSPIPESGTRRLSKSRAGSAYLQHDGALGRHPTMVTNRTRKPTLASMSMASDAWMGSNNQLRLSRANLSGQLSRVSARSYAQSLSRISQAPGQHIKAGESVLSVAMSGMEPKEFARPLSRNDIFLQGSIRNLKEFENEGGNFHRYRESQISIPMSVAAQNLSSSLSHAGGDIVEVSHRFGGSQYSRMTDGKSVFAGADVEEFEALPVDSSQFKWIPAPIRQALSEMVSLSLLADPVMLLLCISNILGMLGFYVPFVFLIDLATFRGASLSEATFLLSIIGIANTFGRVFFGWMADRRWMSALSITNCSLTSCGLLTILCPFLPTYFLLTLYAGLFGFIVAAYVCLTSILLSDLLGVERLTNSFGILVVARGIASLVGTPIAGIVFDLTQSYKASFCFSGILIFLAGLVSCSVAFVHRYQRSQLLNEGDYVEPKKTLAAAADQPADAQSGKLSVLTERSEEDNLTEYQRTIQSIKQQRALLQELEQYKQRREVVDEEQAEEEGGAEAGLANGEGRGGTSVVVNGEASG